MYPFLALQVAAIAFAVLMGTPSSLQPVESTPGPVIKIAAAQPQRLHCRLYFGCAPVQKASAEGARD